MADEDKKRGQGKRGQKKRKRAKKGREAGALRRKKPDGHQRAQLIDAIAHPVRRRMLRVLIDTREPRSPAQLERELSHPLGTIAYHARVLRQCQAIEPGRKRMVRGAVEHFYTTTIEDDPPIETLLEETRGFDDGGC